MLVIKGTAVTQEVTRVFLLLFRFCSVVVCSGDDGDGGGGGGRGVGGGDDDYSSLRVDLHIATAYSLRLIRN